MSLIKISSAGPDGKCFALCAVCEQKVGVFTIDEIREMSRDDVIVTCFNCDPLFADSVPSVLYLAEEQYLLSIDGNPFLADWTGDRHALHKITWSAWMTLVSGFKPSDSLFLSSSTYLHGKVCKCGKTKQEHFAECQDCYEGKVGNDVR